MSPIDRDTTKREKSVIYISPPRPAKYKLTIDDEDVTNKIVNLEVEDGVTDIIGRFSIEFYNPNNIYTNKWTGMETVRYYKDYETTATTLRFRGRIEKISYQGHKIKLTGRSEALKFLNITVTKSYINENCDVILKDLIDNYGSSFTYVNVNLCTAKLTVNWSQKPFWECVQELCTASGYDCYVDASLDFHFNIKGSVKNIVEGIIHNKNLVSVGDYGDDIVQSKNRIIVYGAEKDGIKQIYTAEDTANQAIYGIREKVINDSNVTTYEQAKDLADYELAKSKEPVTVGEVKGILLATIQPGEQILVSSPNDNIPGAHYNIVSYKDQVGEGKFFTTVRINKEPKKVSDILKDNIQNIDKAGDKSINPEEMRYSYDFLFDADSGTHANTEISGGNLQLETGNTSGNWISPRRTVNANITDAYIVAVGEDLSNIIFQVSSNDGVNYEACSNKSRITLINQEKKLRVKVIFSAATARLDSLQVQYKTE